QVELGLGKLASPGVKHLIAVQVDDPGCTDGAVEGDARNGQRGQGTDHGGDVRINFGVYRHGVHNYMDIVVEPLGKQGVQGAPELASASYASIITLISGSISMSTDTVCTVTWTSL